MFFKKPNSFLVLVFILFIPAALFLTNLKTIKRDLPSTEERIDTVKVPETPGLIIDTVTYASESASLLISGRVNEPNYGIFVEWVEVEEAEGIPELNPVLPLGGVPLIQRLWIQADNNGLFTLRLPIKTHPSFIDALFHYATFQIPFHYKMP